MSPDPTLVVAHKQNQLWPAIHAATDVFLRRRSGGAEPFELIWRLIHIWECCTITLGAAAAARIHSLPALAEADRSIREKCFGVARNDVSGKLEGQGFGAFDGSVDRWIEIIFLIAALPRGHSLFLDAFSDLMNEPTEAHGAAAVARSINVSPFIEAWRRACDVPSSLVFATVEAKAAFRVVNQFRNRFAHVPFPDDRLDDILRSLENATLRLFELQDLGSGAALLGGIRSGRHLVVGASHLPDLFEVQTKEPQYVFNRTKREAGEQWPARPFVHIDRMMRPYALTRLRDQEGSWEYTRYLAESNAVVLVTDPALVAAYRRPEESEYPPAPQPVESNTSPSSPNGASEQAPVLTAEDALSALQRREFQRAIPFLERLVAERPHYHTGWLRLGIAKREMALQVIDTGHPHAAEKLLREAGEAIEKALGHVEPSARSDALYHLSKVHYRLWLVTTDKEEARRAVSRADGAYQLWPEERSATWVEYLEQRLKGVLETP